MSHFLVSLLGYQLRSENLAVASQTKRKTRKKWLYCDDNFRLGFRAVGHQHIQLPFSNLNFHFLFPKTSHAHTIVAKQRRVSSWFPVNSLNEPIFSCLIKASESKYSTDSFILSFIEGSSVTSDLWKNLKISHKSWQDRFAESVFSNMLPERGTPVLFALCHAMYLLREKRDQNKQWLLGEHIAFWLTRMISYEDFWRSVFKFLSSFLNMIEMWTYSILKCRSG